MNNSRTKNSIRNIIYGVFNRTVSIIFPFIVRTIFIKTIGEEYLGLNTLYASILQVLNLADLGFSTAIVASMYKPIAEKNIKKVSALLKLFRNIYRVIGIAILTVGLILTPFIKYFINGEPPIGINIYFLWILYLLNTVVSYLLFAYRVSLLNAHQRNDITEKIGAVSRILTSLLQIYVVAVLRNVYLYVILTVVCSIIYNVWCSRACKKLYPQYICEGDIDQQTKTKITKDILALTIQKIGNTVSLSLDSIIISAFLGLTTVAIYGNYYYIISAVSTFVALIYSAITASIGNSIVTESIEKNYEDLKKFFFINTWVIGWCCICFLCLFQDFMILWMGKKLLFSMWIVLSLVLRFFFEQIRKIVLTYKDAAGLWWHDKWRPLVGCGVNLIFNIVLVKTIGVAGVAISTIISYAFVEMPWETWALFKYYFKKKTGEYYLEMLWVIITISISGGGTYFICSKLPMTGVLAIAVKLLICIVITNIIFVLLNLNNKYFKKSIDIVFKIKDIFFKRT